MGYFPWPGIYLSRKTSPTAVAFFGSPVIQNDTNRWCKTNRKTLKVTIGLYV